jgi:hypothetical protein
MTAARTTVFAIDPEGSLIYALCLVFKRRLPKEVGRHDGLAWRRVSLMSFWFLGGLVIEKRSVLSVASLTCVVPFGGLGKDPDQSISKFSIQMGDYTFRNVDVERCDSFRMEICRVCQTHEVRRWRPVKCKCASSAFPRISDCRYRQRLPTLIDFFRRLAMGFMSMILFVASEMGKN